ncbi:MAG: hypothetical protein P8Z37_09025 [Acidobacteriota bacterium]|jgi:hypothetical protein
MKNLRSSIGRQAAVPVSILVLGAVMIVPLLRAIDMRRGGPGPDLDLLYFSSPSVVQKMALGYDHLLSDIYWIRTIQYFGGRDASGNRRTEFKNLAPLLDIVTTLDPKHIDAYRMGSIFLGEEALGAGQPEEAVKLLSKGIRANPEAWILRFDKGFVYYLYLNDFDAAGKEWLEASRVPGAPDWMAGLAATAYSKGNSMDLAIALWKQQYEEATREDLKENAKNRLISLQVAEDIWTLEYLLEIYWLQYDRYPQSLTELSPESGGLVTMDPMGTPYNYNPETGTVGLDPQSKVVYLEVPESYKEDFLKRKFQ